ncbi:MAG: flagellar motor protein MotB [Fidelibacterota bacterium]
MPELINPLAEKRKNNWLISYGDLITLLITFFIMMLSAESGKISNIHKWVNSQLLQSALELEQSISEKNIRGIDVRHDTKGVHISIQSEGMFPPGEAEPSVALISQLKEISRALKHLNILNANQSHQFERDIQFFNNLGLEWSVKILIEGHTDNTPLIRGSKFENNWELSAARAQSVMRILQNDLSLPARQFAIKGYGEFKPLVPNTSIRNRLLNRRVDIIISASLLKNGKTLG